MGTARRRAFDEASLSMPDDQKLTTDADATLCQAAAPRQAQDGAHDPGPQPGNLCRDSSYAGIVTAVRKVVERNAAFGS